MATNFDDIITIRNRFTSLWPEEVRVIFDNEPNSELPKGLFARLSIQPGAQRRQGTGVTKYDQLGRVFLQVFIPAQGGTREGFTLADLFTRIFRDWSSDDYRIRFDEPTYRTSDAEKAYFMILCSVPYTAEH